MTEGVTVIHGLNGSGKSSLLEGCFFALYGAKALPSTLEDVVTNGAEEAEIELWFDHDGGEYHLYRRIRWSGERPQTAECTLEGPEATVEGARDVRTFITDLLRMDAEAFVNCAYVRQGEVNKLINATPNERQRMIDDLLQLGKLEEYRERASEARLGVEDVLSSERGRLEELESQITEKEDRELHATLNTLETERNDVDEEIEHFREQRDQARETREQATEILEEHEQTREELATAEEAIDDLDAEIREAEREREQYRERAHEAETQAETHREQAAEIVAELGLESASEAAIGSRRDTLDHRESVLRERLQNRRDEVTAYKNQAERLRERADEHDDRASEKRQRADRLDDEAETAADERADHEQRLQEAEAELDEIDERFADAPIERGEADRLEGERRETLEDLRETLNEVRAERRSLRDSIEQAQNLLEAGNCPECGQPVEDSPHVDQLAEDRERLEALEERLEDLQESRKQTKAALERAKQLVEFEARAGQLTDTRDLLAERIEDATDEIETNREKATRLREEATELAEQATQKREIAGDKDEQATTVRAEIEAIEADLEEIETVRARLTDAQAQLDAATDQQTEAERLRERADSAAAVNDQRRERLADLRDRKKDLRDAVDEDRIQQARENKQEAETYLDRVEEKLDALGQRRDELQSKIGGVKQDLTQLEELRDQREALAERVAALESLHEESDLLESTYGDLRAELRQRNVESLERMLNETFELIYGNDAYARIRLDGEYELTVIQKDGDPLDPEQLSGGERALFNLSLRCAIYRLLAEGIEGTAPLPPLILDEPTVFLDSGHVSRLVDLVAEMRDLGVRQIVIVSHDDELVGAADDLITVEKNPMTNRSTARRVEEASLAAVESIADD